MWFFSTFSHASFGPPAYLRSIINTHIFPQRWATRAWARWRASAAHRCASCACAPQASRTHACASWRVTARSWNGWRTPTMAAGQDSAWRLCRCFATAATSGSYADNWLMDYLFFLEAQWYRIFAWKTSYFFETIFCAILDDDAPSAANRLLEKVSQKPKPQSNKRIKY